jgi:hypothetical protein
MSLNVLNSKKGAKHGVFFDRLDGRAAGRGGDATNALHIAPAHGCRIACFKGLRRLFYIEIKRPKLPVTTITAPPQV